jgi:hypothetical protein
MKCSYAIIAVIVFSNCFSQPVMADILTLNAVTEISGGTSPVGTPPWLTATFNDHGTPGTVDLTLASPNLTDSEFVSEWDLNLAPSLNPSNLSFSITNRTGSFTDPSISKGIDEFKADGDGYTDISFGFATGGGASKRFGVGDFLTVQITGISTLNAQSFNYQSYGGGGSVHYYMVAHVQAIGPGSDSGWVAPTESIYVVPEPTSLLLLVLGISGLSILGRRRLI